MKPLLAMKPGRPFRRLAPAVLAWLIAACATAPAKAPPPRMLVANQSSKPLDLQYRPCGESTWRTWRVDPIPPGAAWALPVLDGCVDLRAVKPDGEVGGIQTNLEAIPGFQWTIQ